MDEFQSPRPVGGILSGGGIPKVPVKDGNSKLYPSSLYGSLTGESVDKF